MKYFSITFCLALLSVTTVAAQQSASTAPSAATWAATASNKYLIYPDVVYGRASNHDLKLDIWQRKDQKSPAPTLVYYHGGGWIFGDRTGATLFFLPFLQRGWNVVNIEYRMADVAQAPAAVEDARCALEWVVANAAKYNVDTNRIVLTGHSAGGHLALITGMLPDGSPLGNRCYTSEKLQVAAVINWYGISDAVDLIHPPNLKNYAIMWIGSSLNADAVAKEVSPLTYVRRGLPPVISIHGSEDPVVPYQQSVRLHAALDKAGVPNELVTIQGGQHGEFSDAELVDAYTRIDAFLRKHQLID